MIQANENDTDKIIQANENDTGSENGTSKK